MSSPPLMDDTEPAAGLLARLRALSRLQRELLLYAFLVLGGALLMPLLIWVVGNRVLGPYTHGQNAHAGALALLGDFLVGLVHGSAVFWAVALGPAALLLLVRLFVLLFRALPRSRGD